MTALRKAARLVITRERLIELMMLPAGTELVAVGEVWHDQSIDLVVVGPGLPECGEAEMLPVVHPVYEIGDQGNVQFVKYCPKP